jgi:hypothetical protein
LTFHLTPSLFANLSMRCLSWSKSRASRGAAGSASSGQGSGRRRRRGGEGSGEQCAPVGSRGWHRGGPTWPGHVCRQRQSGGCRQQQRTAAEATGEVAPRH